MHFRILNMIATSGFLSFSVNKFVIDQSFGPRWGSLQRSLRAQAGLRGLTFKEKGRGEKGRRGEGKVRKRRGGEGRGSASLTQIPGSASDLNRLLLSLLTF